MEDLSSLTREQTYIPVVEAQSLNHWTGREDPRVDPKRFHYQQQQQQQNGNYMSLWIC